MQNDQSQSSVARKQRGKRETRGDGDVLSPDQQRGDTFRRVVGSAAYRRGIYTADDLAEAAGVSRGTVRGWWDGALPKPETIPGITRATGLDSQELIAWVHLDGPVPRLPNWEDDEVRERADSADRAIPGQPASGASEGPPAPRGTKG